MRIRSAARAALAMAAMFATAVVLAAGCAAAPDPPPARPTPWVSAAEISGTGLRLTEAGGLYATWDAAPQGAALPRMVLARFDARTGAVAARNAFSPGSVGAPLFADGALWVTDSGPLGEFLLRMDPGTLMVTGELKFAARQYRSGAHLAYAGGWLWLDGGDELLRVSPVSVVSTAVIALRGALTSDVGASPDGSVLVVLAVPAASERGRSASVQRRNPATGALLAARPVSGAVVIDGFAGSGVWITRAAGTSADAERYSADTLRPAVTVPVADGAGVRVADGMLWVTGDQGGDYCADALSGRRLAALPGAVPRHGELLAVGDRVLYYAVPARSGSGWRITAVPVPAGCG